MVNQNWTIVAAYHGHHIMPTNAIEDHSIEKCVKDITWPEIRDSMAAAHARQLKLET